MTPSSSLLTLGLLALLPGCWIAHDQGHPYAATPQRPTVSSDTNTTAEGTVEMETGVHVNPHDDTATPITLKWGATERTEIFVGGSPYVKIDRDGTDVRGRSDSLVGVRHRFIDADDENGGVSWATQFAVDLTDGSHRLSNGEYDVLLAGIASGSMGEWSWTGFYQYGQVGALDGDGHQSQHVATLALGLPVDDRWSAFGELAVLKQRSFTPFQAIMGAAWSRTPGVVWDISLRGGLNDDANDDVSVLAGVTVNFGSRDDGDPALAN